MKATLWKNCEILSFYYGPKKAYETTWEIRVNSEVDAALWKKFVKSYSNLLIHINFVCGRFA